MEELLTLRGSPVLMAYWLMILLCVSIGSYIIFRLLLSQRDIPREIKDQILMRANPGWLTCTMIALLLSAMLFLATGLRMRPTSGDGPGVLDTTVKPGVLDTTIDPEEAQDEKVTNRGKEIQEERFESLDEFREKFLRGHKTDGEEPGPESKKKEVAAEAE